MHEYLTDDGEREATTVVECKKRKAIQCAAIDKRQLLGNGLCV